MDEDYARRLRNWLRAEPGATPGQAAQEREWLRGIPQPGSAPDERDRPPGEQLLEPEPTADRDRPVDRRLPEPGSGETWSVRGQLPAAHPAADEEWICPVIALPVPRPSRENGCRMSEAEARSRWNHPTNWHRRRQAEEQQRDHPGGR
ncbi:hypothetical protein [Amycolatopsis vastitatis]|uniref:Uncharacterized protein n=1 Tax=Amycolatopsis vastitatis TaxID=1905142 RepID=A0A229T790_9PSEU|nr:hypothetical protein [Amycolatopsis vastitatis]OXM66900.1 hypothetical protein CF165_19190 [Amycolatopsis vastitatis]